MEAFLQIVIVLAFIFSLVQVIGLVRLKNTQVKMEWFMGALLAVGLFEFLAYRFGLGGKELVWYLLLLAVSLWANLVKFSLGLIQKKEIGLYNRLEHFFTGLLIFLALGLLGVNNLLAVEILSRWTEGFLVLLLVSFYSMGAEVVELFLDRIKGENYMIGPRVDDTNMDLLMTFLGSLMGWIIWGMIG